MTRHMTKEALTATIAKAIIGKTATKGAKDAAATIMPLVDALEWVAANPCADTRNIIRVCETALAQLETANQHPSAATVQDHSVATQSFYQLVLDARSEAYKAMRKFPQPNYVLLKVAEEAGEVVKAAVHFAEGRETRQAVVDEMRQTIAMLYRLWVEGDEVNGVSAIAGGEA